MSNRGHFLFKEKENTNEQEWQKSLFYNSDKKRK